VGPFVRLVALTDDEREAFIREDVADYGAQLERDEGIGHEAALARARDVFAPTVRDEHATADGLGHRRFSAIDASGSSVGWIWVIPAADGAPDRAFLYQLTVKPEGRRRGYATAMLEVLERVLAAEGVVELRLNVFDANVPARRLYARAGYEVHRQLKGKSQLRKRLDGGPGVKQP
jgi:ribosomal protein S18 acetylase RimI-like enzyme